MLVMSNYVLPILGVALVVFCVFSFVLPYGEKFQLREKTQKFKGFGVDFEVSVIALFFGVGVLLSLTGLYLHVRDYQRELESVRAEKAAAEKALAQAQKIQVSALVTLDGADLPGGPEGLRLDDLECRVLTNAYDQPRQADLSRGYGTGQYKILLRDLSPEIFVRRLEVVHTPTRKKWVQENFSPLEPSYHLKPGP